MSTITRQKSKYETIADELDGLFNSCAMADYHKAMVIIAKYVDDAFQRGLSAGIQQAAIQLDDYHKLEVVEVPDSVFNAQQANIMCPDTLSTLYSKEQGFKQ